MKRQRYSHIPSHPQRRATQLPLYQRVHAARQGRVFFFVCRSVYRSATHTCRAHAAHIHCWHTLFFSAHCACRSSHQISREWEEWDEMWGGGFSHSCTCVCTRTYTRVRPFDGSRKLSFKWARRERMCTLSLSFPAPASRILCLLCVHVCFACLSVCACVCLFTFAIANACMVERVSMHDFWPHR